MEFPIVYDKNDVQIQKINDEVYYRVGNLEKKRQCNGGFIVLEDCTVAVDVPSEEAAIEMLSESLELFSRPIKHAIITHAHPDHDLGIAHFEKVGGIHFYGSFNATNEFKEQKIPKPKLFSGVLTSFTIPSASVEIILEKVPIQAHSPWDILVHLPKYNLMFTGDLVACEPILYLESCSLSGWIDYLKKLQQREISIFARGHGGCMGSECIEDEIKYLTALRSVAGYMYENITITKDDISDEKMGVVLKNLCDAGNRDALYLYEKSAEAAHYQLTQFYRYGLSIE